MGLRKGTGTHVSSSIAARYGEGVTLTKGLALLLMQIGSMRILGR